MLRRNKLIASYKLLLRMMETKNALPRFPRNEAKGFCASLLTFNV